MKSFETNPTDSKSPRVQLRPSTATTEPQGLGDLLRLARRSKGLTQTDLARHIGASSGQLVSDWERGYGPRPPVAQLKKVIAYLGLSQSEVLKAYVRQELARREAELILEWNQPSNNS